MSPEPRGRTPPLRMLATFEALARHGTRAAAAAELNVTLGAVGKQLRALEQWLGTPLFEADTRDPPMTAAGRRLAQAMTAGMETIQIGLDEVTRHRPAAVELRILAPASLSMNWLVPRLPQLEQTGPALRVQLHATHTGEDWLPLPHDAAIRRDGFLPAGYRSEPLFREILAAFAAPALIERFAGPELLERIPLLESRTRLGELDRWLAETGMAKLGRQRRSFAHFYTAYEAALAEDGLVIAPTLIAAEDVAAGRLTPVHPDVVLRGAQHVLVSRAQGEADASLRLFVSWLRRQVALSEEAGREGIQSPTPVQAGVHHRNR